MDILSYEYFREELIRNTVILAFQPLTLDICFHDRSLDTAMSKTFETIAR